MLTNKRKPLAVPLKAIAAQIATSEAFLSHERQWLEGLYSRYHRREYICSDPLELAGCDLDLLDREIVALLAALLAYGNVAAIRSAVRAVLQRLGHAPRDLLRDTTRQSLDTSYRGFKYRFTTGADLSSLLWGVRSVIIEFGSIEACFSVHAREGDGDVGAAIAGFVDTVTEATGDDLLHLLPHPKRGSACKRMNLFLRWMVRHDEIDPGGWTAFSPSQLIIPLDTHVQKIAKFRGWTNYSQPSWRAAVEVTSFLRRIHPEDPLRYDFAMTRPGILRRRVISDSGRRYTIGLEGQ